jgi:hypothetical protein
MSKINGDNQNNAMCEASIHFKNKKKHLDDNINELGAHRKNNNTETYLGINEFKKGNKPRTNLVKNEMIFRAFRINLRMTSAATECTLD